MSQIRGRMPPHLDDITAFFWNVEIPNYPPGSYMDTRDVFRRSCWHWKGSYSKTGSPWIKDRHNNRYLSAQQYIFKQLHPGSERLGIELCNNLGNECVNPFHMTQTENPPRGRKRTIPVRVAFIETANRSRLLHHCYNNLIETENETLLQRSDPRYFDDGPAQAS